MIRLKKRQLSLQPLSQKKEEALVRNSPYGSYVKFTEEDLRMQQNYKNLTS